MTPKKTILRELDRIHEIDPDQFTRPAAIEGFSDQASRYQAAVNDLLKERLIDGRKDEEGHMAIALNPHRIADVRRELRPILARPALWIVVVLLSAAAAAPFLI
jgi:hypothetical protein